MSLFCRHNRFTSECPICSKGTVHDSRSATARRTGSSSGAATRRSGPKREAPSFKGAHASVGPYADEDAASYEVRLERVPGGVRLAEWSGSQIRRRAPILDAGDLRSLLEDARGKLAERDADALTEALQASPSSTEGQAMVGVSRGRSGDFREELRVELIEGDRLRVGRWIQKPVAGWELQEAPPMLPAGRFAQAIADAVGRGLDIAGGETEQPVVPS